MKKAFLSAAAVMAGLALAGSPAMAQSNEIVIGITVTTTGPAAASRSSSSCSMTAAIRPRLPPTPGGS